MCPQKLDELEGGEDAVVLRNPAALFQVSQEIAATSMRFLATMSLIDQAMTSAASAALETDYQALCAMLEKVIGTRRRNDARTAAIERALADEQVALDYFARIRKPLRALGDLRNKIAHEIWAASLNHPDLLILIPVKSISAGEADQRRFVDDARDDLEKVNPKPENVMIGPLPEIIDRGAAMVYTHDEIRDANRHAIRVYNELSLFASVVGNRMNPRRDEHLLTFSQTILKRLPDA